MAGAALFALVDEPDSGRRDGLADLIGLVSHNHEDSFRGREGKRRIDHVLHQALASRAVQHFRLLRLHAGAETGRKNDHCDGILHLYYYAEPESGSLPYNLRRRPSWASLTITAAAASGS